MQVHEASIIPWMGYLGVWHTANSEESFLRCSLHDHGERMAVTSCTRVPVLNDAQP